MHKTPAIACLMYIIIIYSRTSELCTPWDVGNCCVFEINTCITAFFHFNVSSDSVYYSFV